MSGPIRVLHVLHHSSPTLSGYSIRTNAILSHQRAKGIDVEAVTSAQHENPCADRETVSGVTYYRTRGVATTGAPLAREWRLMRALERRVDGLIREFAPAVVHAHSPVLVAWPALRAARKAGLPMIYEVRDLWENTSIDLGKFTDGSVQFRLARAADSYVLGRADAVVTICEGLSNAVRSRVARSDRLFVVPNGVDAAKFADRVSDVDARRRWHLDGKTVIAYVGTFQPYEGLDLLVESMQDVARQRPDAHLLIAGNGAMEERLRELVSERGLSRVVTMTGPLPHAEVAQVYAVADVLAYPRRLTATTAITTPLKPLEAMAMGKPVLVSDVPALLELVQPNVTGAVFRAGDRADLARQLLILLDEPQVRQRLGAAGRQWVTAARDWSGLVSRYLTVYTAVTQPQIATR